MRGYDEELLFFPTAVALGTCATIFPANSGGRFGLGAGVDKRQERRGLAAGIYARSSITGRGAGQVGCVHTGYVVRARLLPLQEFAVEVAEFDFEFLACGVGEFGEGCTIEPVRLPALFEDLFEALEAVAFDLMDF